MERINGEGNKPVEDIGVRPGLDRIGEAVAGPDLGTDDLAGHAEDVLGDLVGDDDPLAGDLGEVHAPGGRSAEPSQPQLDISHVSHR
jgi:hypothetical protein